MFVGVAREPESTQRFVQGVQPAAVKDVILSSAVTGSEDAKKRVLLQLVVELLNFKIIIVLMLLDIFQQAIEGLNDVAAHADGAGHSL